MLWLNRDVDETSVAWDLALYKHIVQEQFSAQSKAVLGQQNCNC